MPKTILIADDNDDLRSILAYQLQQKGYRILMASDGRQAVEKCRAERPDLVLLDVMMPVQDGTEAAAALKADPATQNIPIIFLTSLAQEAQEALSEGQMTLPKSVALEDLLARIEIVLR
jgi:CheY-like chemotaxis protein